ALLHIVTAAPPQAWEASLPWLIDPAGELGRAFGAMGPLAIVVDAGGRVASVLSPPTPEAVAALVGSLYAASTPTIVQAKAPVLLLDRVLDTTLCQTLIEYWQAGGKRINEVGSQSGHVVNPDLKRRPE